MPISKYKTLTYLLFYIGEGFPEFIVLNSFNGGGLVVQTGDLVIGFGDDAEGGGVYVIKHTSVLQACDIRCVAVMIVQVRYSLAEFTELITQSEKWS